VNTLLVPSWNNELKFPVVMACGIVKELAPAAAFTLTQ
jgi:hypothetical protein